MCVCVFVSCVCLCPHPNPLTTRRYADRGIIPRAVSQIYAGFRKRTDVQFKAFISYLELYNEAGYDLLDPSHETKALEELPKVNK